MAYSNADTICKKYVLYQTKIKRKSFLIKRKSFFLSAAPCCLFKTFISAAHMYIW